MSEHNVRLRFDGPSLRTHMMDVTVLGPSIFALGELCQEANRVLNGDKTTVKVLINADVKANCVTLDLQVWQSAWDAAKALIQDNNVASAKEILEWIGIVKPVLGAVTLIAYLRWKKNHKEESATAQQSEGKTFVFVNIGNNNTQTVTQQVYNLSKSIPVVESLKTLVEAVSDENGIDEATFISDNIEQIKIDKACARELGEARADADEMKPQPFDAFITVYQPTLDIKSKKWKFRFNQRVESIDISQTKIVENAMKRGKVVIGDTYKVQMEMTQRRTKNGDFKADFKVLKVIEFLPGNESTQTVLPFPSNEP